MTRFMALILCVQLVFMGCQASSPQGRPNWLERRVNRFITWDSHHGHPVRNTTNAIFATTMMVTVAAGIATAYVAGAMLESYLNDVGGTKNYRGPFWEE